MQMRIMGTRQECSQMVNVIRAYVPEEFIRSISGFYPNRRKNVVSNEGRVYVSFMDLPKEDVDLLPVVKG